MQSSVAINLISRGIILFWGVWFLIVTASDVVNFLQRKNVISPHISFTSNNYKLVDNVLSVYKINAPTVVDVLFIAIILWAFAISLSFFFSLFAKNFSIAYFAFMFSFSMTAFFILCDEVFIQYELGHEHILRLLFQMIAFICFYMISIDNFKCCRKIDAP